jgi:hypothetical protein
MNSQTFSLDIKTDGTGAGTPRTCKDLLDKWVQIGGDMSGFTLAIEGSINGTEFVAVVANITAVGIYSVPHGIVDIQINTIVDGGEPPDVPTATLFGRNAETDP